MLIYSIWFPFVDTRIRARVFNELKVNFPSIDAAEEHYNLTLSNYVEVMEGTLDTGGRGLVESPRRLVDKVTRPLKIQCKTIQVVPGHQHPILTSAQFHLLKSQS